MIFRHTFHVQASVEAVAAFHRRSDSLQLITPPPAIVRVHHAPPELADGDEMDFTLWMGPIPVRWLARIENVTTHGFVDRQINGPFRAWVHTHTFVPLDDGSTEVRDAIEAMPGGGLWNRLLSLGMWLTLPVLFAYRGWRTRQLLTGRAADR
ncbi:MAG: SRPBCC family protein [Anaerolineae bacterium]|nr:SRPBCC family protein [Anaerolineae bacterium]